MELLNKICYPVRVNMNNDFVRILVLLSQVINSLIYQSTVFTRPLNRFSLPLDKTARNLKSFRFKFNHSSLPINKY